ncbi:vWA domain-containing protein [Gryllotalpicola protaetiae]|uniref:VWA domain-containing protein n=1 Tax=Gryllotalpicola protaetiae TaxID=2419771 RepID=A0A387BSJ0_9MICO|nr:VWA domain-containing protein [Gryllotalpicola protaetiae]AYG03986.1 VWA domain-containing protein [Gryllotalpicola protaetiae]
MPEPPAAPTDTRTFAVDTAAFSVAFAAALRRAGVPVTPDRSAWLVEALRLIPPRTRSELYWSSRAVLVTAHEQLRRFDAVFDAVFGGAADLSDSRGDPNAPSSDVIRRRTAVDWRPLAPSSTQTSDGPTPPASPGDGDGDGDNAARTDALLLATSPEERLHETSFAALDEDELARMRRLAEALVLATPLRPGRRERRSPRERDRLDLRRTLRAAHRTGGDPVRLLRTSPRPTPRRLVILCDVSASMEPYTRAFLSFMQAAVVTSRAEAFVFATRLTRLTRQLAVRDPDLALDRATGGAQDWAGGTRLADGIRSFIDEHGRRGAARGAVVVVISDGWAQDDPADIGRQMARLARLAHRIVWVNPRKAAPGYQPLTGGMAAALPYCDAFVSGHSFAALQELVRVIADDETDQKRRT